MADVVNLRLVRKAKHRTTKEAVAAENRAKFGRPKAEKSYEISRASLEAKKLEGHRLTPLPKDKP